MNNKRKPVNPTVTIRIQDSRFDTEALDNIQIVIRAQLIRCSGERRTDHRLHHIHANGAPLQPGAVVHHHGNLAGAHPVQGSLGNPGGDDGLAIQFLLRKVLQVSDGTDNDMGLGHCVMKRPFHQVLTQSIQRRSENGLHRFHGRRPEHDGCGQRGIGFQLFQGGQQPGHAEIHVRIGEQQVFSVFRQRPGNSITGLSVHEKHAGIVEKMPQFGLGMAYGPFLQDRPQPCTCCHGLVRHTGLKASGIRVFKLLPAHLIVIVHHAQADGIGLMMYRLQNGLGPRQIAVCANSDNPERLA